MKRGHTSVFVLCLALLFVAFAAAATVEKEPTAADLEALREFEPRTLCRPQNCHTYGTDCDTTSTDCQCTSTVSKQCTCKAGHHNKHRECISSWLGICWSYGPEQCDACNTPNPVGCKTSTWNNPGEACDKKCTQCMPGYTPTYDHKCAACKAPEPPVAYCDKWSDWAEADTCKKTCLGCADGRELVNGKCVCTNTDHCLEVSSYGPGCSVLCAPGKCEKGWQNNNYNPSVCTECSAPSATETEHCSAWQWLSGCTWECTGCKDGRALVDGKCVCAGGDPHCQGSVSYGPTCEPLCPPGKCVPGWANDVTKDSQCSECSAPAAAETEHCSAWQWLSGCTWKCTGCKDGRALVDGKCVCAGGDPHCQGSVSYGPTCEPLCPPGKCVPGWANDVTKDSQCSECTAWEPIDHCNAYGDWVEGCKKPCTGCEDDNTLENGHCVCKDPHCRPLFDVSTYEPTCNPLCKPNKCVDGFTNFGHKGKCILKNFCPANEWQWKDTPTSPPRASNANWCATNCNVDGPSYLHPACIPMDYAIDPVHRRCYCKDPKFE